MTWTIQGPDDEAILREIYQDSDRAAAIIAAAYLEDRLRDALRARLVTDEKIESQLFRGSGALAAHGTRVKLGYLLGLYDEKAMKLLNTIAKIRNQSAHSAAPKTFESDSIHDLCKTLDIGVKVEGTINAPDGSQTPLRVDLKSDGTPKTAFLNAIQYLLLLLELEIKVPPSRKPAPPAIETILSQGR